MGRDRWVVAAVGDEGGDALVDVHPDVHPDDGPDPAGDPVLDRALRAARAGTAEGVEVVYLARTDAAGAARAAVAEDATRVVLSCAAGTDDDVRADVEQRLAGLDASDVVVRTLR